MAKPKEDRNNKIKQNKSTTGEMGYTLPEEQPTKGEVSFVAPSDDGSLDTFRAGGYYGTYLDLDGAAKTESELIKRYRDISIQADVDMAIEDIVNEAIANIDEDPPVELNLDGVDKAVISENVKKSVFVEFKHILKLMQFDVRAHDYFRRWYIDGRINFHKVIDVENTRRGLVDIRYIDPRKIKKVREIEKVRDPKTGVDFIKNIKEFFVFNSKGLGNIGGHGIMSTTTQGLKITKDSIAFCPSGLADQDNNMVLSYLHKAIKPANQLRMMENSLVIYRLARAPERRIFYVDVGNLPKIKAEQYLKDTMNRFRNKLVYDANTGEIRDDKKYMSMLEDFWLARREGGKGTEIDTLPGGENLGQIDDVLYFQKKLYQALNVPMSRLEQQGGLNFGRAAEITRDELKFVKFIDKLQKRFSLLFQDLLKTQLLLKGVLTEDDWDKIKDDIRYKYAQDAYYAEAKAQEILTSRFNLLTLAVEYQGIYFSKKYVQKKILRMTDEEILEEEKEMKKEPPNPMGAGGMIPGGGNPESDPELLAQKDEDDKDHELEKQKIDNKHDLKTTRISAIAKKKAAPKKK
jgi:hypothetical protein